MPVDPFVAFHPCLLFKDKRCLCTSPENEDEDSPWQKVKHGDWSECYHHETRRNIRILEKVNAR